MVSASDLVFYAAASKPLNDSDAGGGAIDLKTKILTAIEFDDSVSVVSSSVLDAQRLTITGRARNGLPIQRSIALDGTTVVRDRFYFDIVTDVRLNSDAVGTVTIKQFNSDTTFVSIAAGKRGWTSPFANAYPLERNNFERYDKVFLKNEHASVDLVLPAIKVSSEFEMELGISAAVSDTLSIADRITSPADITFSDADSYNSFATLAHGAHRGFWLKQILGGKTRPEDSSIVLTVVSI